MLQPARRPPLAPHESLWSLQPWADSTQSHTDATWMPPDVMSNAEVGSLPSLLSADKQSFGAILIARALTSSLDPTGSLKGARQLGFLRHGQASASRVCPDRLHSRPRGAAEAVCVGGQRGDVARGCGMEPVCRWGQLVVNPPTFFLTAKGARPRCSVQSNHDHGGHQPAFMSKHLSNSCPGRACGVSQTPQTSFGGEGSYIQSTVPWAHWKR